MLYEYFVADFIERTNKNFNRIKGGRERDKYDVTQAINSLLGTVIIPKEAYQNEAKALDNQRACQEDIEGIDRIVKECLKNDKIFCSYSTTLDAIEFLRHIRNSVAHGGNQGLSFYPAGRVSGKIETIIFYDENPDNSEEKFCVELDISQVIALSRYSGNIYSYIDKKKGIQDLYPQINEKRALFSRKSKAKDYRDFGWKNTHG